MSHCTGSITLEHVRKLRMGASNNQIPLNDYIDESEADENDSDESKSLSVTRHATSTL